MKNPKDKIIVVILLLFALFLSYSIVIFSEDISLSAKSSVLYEPEGKRFLFAKNADIPLPMASTTKIMTALVAFENSLPDDTVTVCERAVGVEGSSLYLKAGERLKMSDLIAGLMLRSANDAAEAIAYHISGSVEGFAELMNAKAKSLGLTLTSFKNPHGLHDDGHYTTARELAIISAEALSKPAIKDITSKKRVTIKNEDGEARLVLNHNKLLSLYDGAIGVKTGFTKKAGRCLVGAAERDGLTFITVTINAPDDWNDHAKLFDYGFSLFEMRTLIEEGQFSYEIPVVMGASETVFVKNTATVQKITERSRQEPTYEVDIPRYAVAPIEEGARLGTVKIYVDGELIAEEELIAQNAVLKQKKRLFNF